MVLKFIAATAAFVLSTIVAIADPVGRYSARGTNPDGSTYSGRVQVTQTGSTYRVVWDIGGQSFTRTGIGSNDFMAVSYRTGNQTGIALYGRKSDGTWEGVWAYAGGRDVGTDRWVPRD